MLYLISTQKTIPKGGIVVRRKSISNLVLSAMFIAIGLVLPFITGQLRQIGNMLLPMHIPVILCGFICGWQYGLAAGAVLPVLRSILFGMPVLYPNATAMAFELASYGFITGIIYSHSKKQGIFSIYKSLICAMLGGRIIWGIVEVLLLGIGDSGFTYHMFIAGAFLNSVPGIVLQLILIPAIMVALNRAKIIHFKNI